VAVDIEKKTWLADLVAAALQSYDPGAALLRVPAELRGADPEGPSLEARARTLLIRSLRRKLLDPSTAGKEDPFLGPVEGHIGLVLDIALVHGAPFETERRRAELAAFFAALVGAVDLGRAAEPARNGSSDAAAVQKALVRAGRDLKARGHPAGDPKHGLPLRVGVLCIQRRHLARLAISYYGSERLDLAEARKLVEQSTGDTVLLVEALAAIASVPDPLPPHRRRVAVAQVTRLGLPGELARDARAAVRAPRSAAEIAHACPVRLRAFLLEQLLLSELASGQTSAARAEVVQAFASAAQIPPEQVAALQADAAELYAGQQHWLEPTPTAPEEWENLASEWDDVADEMLDKVATVVTENLGAIVTELRQTGELGQLVAKAASGKTLSADEKRKVKSQLLDLAKAVPALAIFAAPGGMLLLPVLAKLLPFNVLPSAWDNKGKRGRPALPAKKAGAS
jgi:LETM1-like protein